MSDISLEDERTTRLLELEAMDEFKEMRVSEWHKEGSSLGLNEAQLELYPLSRYYNLGDQITLRNFE